MKLRKRFAAMGAAIMMMASMSAVSANAASETAYWTARHVNNIGAPASESKTGYATMYASNETYKGNVTSMTNLANRSLTITSSTHTMSKPVVFTNTGSISWTISGTLTNVTYVMVAKTTLNTTLNVSGNIER